MERRTTETDKTVVVKTTVPASLHRQLRHAVVDQGVSIADAVREGVLLYLRYFGYPGVPEPLPVAKPEVANQVEHRPAPRSSEELAALGIGSVKVTNPLGDL